MGKRKNANGTGHLNAGTKRKKQKKQVAKTITKDNLTITVEDCNVPKS
jgi:hypothetical protein